MISREDQAARKEEIPLTAVEEKSGCSRLISLSTPKDILNLTFIVLTAELC
jgi:hypothetical protein